VDYDFKLVDSRGTVLEVRTATPKLSLNTTNLKAPFKFRIRTVDANGNGEWTNWVSVDKDSITQEELEELLRGEYGMEEEEYGRPNSPDSTD
jgi:hypothetical protein